MDSGRLGGRLANSTFSKNAPPLSGSQAGDHPRVYLCLFPQDLNSSYLSLRLRKMALMVGNMWFTNEIPGFLHEIQHSDANTWCLGWDRQVWLQAGSSHPNPSGVPGPQACSVTPIPLAFYRFTHASNKIYSSEHLQEAPALP